MSRRILVAYASVSGSTGEVAETIGQVLDEEGVIVQVRYVGDVTRISAYSAVVLGSSIRVGKWLPEAIRFLETHQEALSRVPVAYFTTCLTMVNDTEESRRTVLAYMEPVLQKAPQIKPVGLGLFAGSLDPDRQLLPMMHSELAPQGDYRDWEAIRAWAEEIRPALLEGDVSSDEPMILRGAVLSYTDMSGADLSRADLRKADLHRANLSEANLQGADLSETDLIRADLHKADLDEASLRKADLNWADLNWANMSGANLSRANLIGAVLNRANLSQANLSQAILNGADLSYANLSGADLSYADLNWANLSGADLSYANLSQAGLGWANLSGADLSHANLSQARYNNKTEWPEGFSVQTQRVIFVGAE
jgi:uncharacterized protein YjbI with pentapeptide repeats